MNKSKISEKELNVLESTTEEQMSSAAEEQYKDIAIKMQNSPAYNLFVRMEAGTLNQEERSLLARLKHLHKYKHIIELDLSKDLLNLMDYLQIHQVCKFNWTIGYLSKFQIAVNIVSLTNMAKSLDVSTKAIAIEARSMGYVVKRDTNRKYEDTSTHTYIEINLEADSDIR